MKLLKPSLIAAMLLPLLSFQTAAIADVFNYRVAAKGIRAAEATPTSPPALPGTSAPALGSGPAVLDSWHRTTPSGVVAINGISGGYEFTTGNKVSLDYAYASGAGKSTGKWYFIHEQMNNTTSPLLFDSTEVVHGVQFPPSWTGQALVLADLDAGTMTYHRCSQQADLLQTIALPAGRTYFPGSMAHQAAAAIGQGRVYFALEASGCVAPVPSDYRAWTNN